MNVINKLIYNRLTAGHSVGLPEIGALMVSQSEAKVSVGRVAAPERKVEFAHIVVGVDSIVDILVGEGKVFEEEAQGIYNEWREKFVKDAGNIDFEKTGKLVEGRLELSEELEREMNPFGDKKDNDMTTENKKRKYGWLWWLGGVIVAIGIAIAILCAMGRWNSFKDMIFGTTEVVVIDITDDIATDISDEIETDEREQIGGENVVAASAQPKYYLIAGVFKIASNADRFIGQNKYRSALYEKLSYKEMTAVSVYSSTSYEDVRKRQREYRAVEPKIWILKQ